MINHANTLIAKCRGRLQQMADIVQQSGQHQFLISIRLPGMPRALFSVRQLGNSLAEILLATGLAEQLDHLIDSCVSIAPASSSINSL